MSLRRPVLSRAHPHPSGLLTPRHPQTCVAFHWSLGLAMSLICVCVCTVILTKWSFIEATTADEFKRDKGRVGMVLGGPFVHTHCSVVVNWRFGKALEPVLSADKVDPCGLECIKEQGGRICAVSLKENSSRLCVRVIMLYLFTETRSAVLHVVEGKFLLNLKFF